MRISKEPEERKQEILETAIKLFSVNGFEKTSISDIAKEIGIAQGLCYRYFPSKDVLFQSAINEYSNILVANMTKNINIKKDSLKDILRKMILFAEQEDDTYYLVLEKGRCSEEKYRSLLNLLMEYSVFDSSKEERVAFIMEHYSVVIGSNAINVVKKYM